MESETSLGDVAKQSLVRTVVASIVGFGMAVLLSKAEKKYHLKE